MTKSVWFSWITALLVVAVGMPSSSAAGSIPTEPEARTEVLISGSVESRARATILRAHELARKRLNAQASCRTLYQQLGADGLERLSSTVYLPATEGQERRICGTAVLAFTAVGSAATRVCRRFADLSDERAAVVLLHEALHFAGLNERPRDPDCPSPREIDQMVERGCGFWKIARR